MGANERLYEAVRSIKILTETWRPVTTMGDAEASLLRAQALLHAIEALAADALHLLEDVRGYAAFQAREALRDDDIPDVGR